jgi:hypothetical protein
MQKLILNLVSDLILILHKETKEFGQPVPH